MRKLLFIAFLLAPFLLFSQKDSTQRVRAFPITSYMVGLNDSTRIVQINLDPTTRLAEKQVGLLRGIYRGKHADTALLGMGRCNLIKGDYYYFTIGHKPGDTLFREGDLLYTMVKKTTAYDGQLLKLAAHYIGFLNVYDQSWYDYHSDIFLNWKKSDEQAVLDSMLNDLHHTGKYFKESDPGMNIKIKGGRYDGRPVLDAMIACTRKDITDFLDYMIARPLLYAGHEWKISETFATWLTSGTPSLVK